MVCWGRGGWVVYVGNANWGLLRSSQLCVVFECCKGGMTVLRLFMVLGLRSIRDFIPRRYVCEARVLCPPAGQRGTTLKLGFDDRFRYTFSVSMYFIQQIGINLFSLLQRSDERTKACM